MRSILNEIIELVHRGRSECRNMAERGKFDHVVKGLFEYRRGAAGFEIKEAIARLNKEFPLPDPNCSFYRDDPHENDHQSPAWKRGHDDAVMDESENVPFASVDPTRAPRACVPNRIAITDMKAPDYIAPRDEEEYLKGYRASAKDMYGDDWKQVYLDYCDKADERRAQK